MKLSIQVKLILTVIVGMLVWGWLHYFIQQHEILPSYREQEERLIREQTQHVRELLSYELEALDQFCYDWSAWDDTYAFIRTHSTDYIESNLVYSSFAHNNLNLIHYTDNSGRKVWHGYYDLSRGEPYTDDTFWSRAQWNLQEEPFLHIEGGEGSVSGLISLKHGVLLIAARPVLPSSAMGEVRGRLVMGRMLDGLVTSRINHHLRNKVEFVPWKQIEASFSDDELDILQQGRVLNHPDVEDVNVMQGYIALFDLWGKPIVVAQVNMERTLMQQGEKALLRNVQGNLIAGSVVLLLMLVILHRFVVLPLRYLTSSVQSIGNNAQWDQLPEKLKGEDEIGVLAREFESMLGRIRAQIEFKDEIAAKLERSKARTRLVLDTTPDAIFNVGADGTIKSSNRGAEVMLGHEEGSLTGKKIYDLMAQPYRERMRERLLADANSCRCFTAGCEARARRRDGSELYVHVRGCPMEEHSEPTFLWTMRDISELKEMHEQVSHHERLAAIGQMGASVAHDVRNPLTGISSGIQLLLKQNELDPSQQTVLEEMLTLSDRIEHTVTQMLAFSKRWEPSAQKINLMVFLEKICAELSAYPGFEAIAFAFSGEKRLYVMADPELMRQVFNNLYQNAQESMEKGGGRIGSIITRAGNMAKVLIKDSGAGMEQEVVTRVLEPFYSTKRAGTGLGLAICHKIVEAHDGTMQFTSKPGEGTTVTITLPLGNQEFFERQSRGAGAEAEKSGAGVCSR